MIDAADKRILSTLKANGRERWISLADRVNLSPSACQRRVETMVEQGVIKKFTIDIDPERVGLTIHAFIQIKVERQGVDRATNFRKTVSSYPEVRSFFKLSGNIDYLIDVVVRDIKALSDFIDEKLLALEGVVDASSAIVLDDLDCPNSAV